MVLKYSPNHIAVIGGYTYNGVSGTIYICTADTETYIYASMSENALTYAIKIGEVWRIAHWSHESPLIFEVSDVTPASGIIRAIDEVIINNLGKIWYDSRETISL